MKTLITFLVLISSINLTKAYESSFHKNVYTASCQFGVPLSTYTVCDELSKTGDRVARCAIDQALDNCNHDNNVDCVRVSVRIEEESSAEFPGYKVCKGEARVHGYEKK